MSFAVRTDRSANDPLGRARMSGSSPQLPGRAGYCSLNDACAGTGGRARLMRPRQENWCGGHYALRTQLARLGRRGDRRANRWLKAQVQPHGFDLDQTNGYSCAASRAAPPPGRESGTQHPPPRQSMAAAAQFRFKTNGSSSGGSVVCPRRRAVRLGAGATRLPLQPRGDR